MFKVGDKVKCIDNKQVEDYFDVGETYVVTGCAYNDHVRFAHTEHTSWHPNRFELIEEEKEMQKQFNPQPGDKIICNNGKEFTCCTPEHLQKEITQKICRNDPILGYGADGWCDWLTDGTCGTEYPEWSIREVIPKQQDEAPSKPESMYSAEDIRKACIDDLGWLEYSFGLLMESLEKVKSPEYVEYLRLKGMFESDKNDE